MGIFSFLKGTKPVAANFPAIKYTAPPWMIEDPNMAIGTATATPEGVDIQIRPCLNGRIIRVSSDHSRPPKEWVVPDDADIMAALAVALAEFELTK